MNRLILPTMFAAALTLGLSACSSTGTPKAEVQPATPAKTGTAPSGAAATSGAGGQNVTGTQTPGYTDERMNPNSPLYHPSVYFAFDRYNVEDKYRPMLQANSNFMLSHPDLKVVVQGNTDARGSREYNLALGQKRAEAVVKVMELMGVPSARLEAISFGKEKPRALGDTEKDYAENRRADIVYSDQPGYTEHLQ